MVSKRLADAFAITLDYLVDDTGKIREVKDQAMLTRLVEIEQLDQEERKTIVHVLNSLLRGCQGKKAYAG